MGPRGEGTTYHHALLAVCQKISKPFQQVTLDSITFSLRSKRSWGTESKALVKSRNTTSVGVDLFLGEAQSL